MNSQDFLTLNLVGAGAFIVWYVVSRGGPRRPTSLNLKAKDSAPVLINSASDTVKDAETPKSLPKYTPRLRVVAEKEKEELQVTLVQVTVTEVTSSQIHPDLVGVKTKSLNIMFVYNCHSWDAYEVLGVPAGSSIAVVTAAYQAALLRSNPSSVDFLETAYKAILNKVS